MKRHAAIALAMFVTFGAPPADACGAPPKARWVTFAGVNINLTGREMTDGAKFGAVHAFVLKKDRTGRPEVIAFHAGDGTSATYQLNYPDLGRSSKPDEGCNTPEVIPLK